MFSQLLSSIITALIFSQIAFADDANLIIVKTDTITDIEALSDYPGRCWGKGTDRIYLWGGDEQIAWLANRQIEYRAVSLDIDEIPYLYLCFIDTDDSAPVDGNILDYGPGFVLATVPLKEARSYRRLRLRRLPLVISDEAPDIQLIYDPYIDSLIGEVSADTIIDFLARLSGEVGIEINGQTDTIHTRYSGTEGNALAAQFIKETLEAYGYQVEYHGFYGGGLRHIAVYDGGLAWTVTEDSDALRTTDGGATWQSLSINTSSMLWGISNVGSDSIWISGNNGTIRFSSNGGDNFVAQSAGTSAFLFGSCFINASEGWIAGDNGLILHTTNAGLNWSSQSTPTSSRMYDICFVGSQDGWAVGRNGTIIHTTNGGASWSAQASNTNERLYGVEFTDVDNGWVVGWAGVVRHTTDGGSTWQTVNLGTAIEKYHVDFSDSVHGCIVGWDGEIFITSDGGTNWQQMSSGTSKNFYGVEFVDNMVGYAVGGGVIDKTTDGGISWINQTAAIEGVWRNIIATRLGTVNPDQQVIICGHMDCTSEQPNTRAPGADDNGSGTTAVIEAARLFSLTDFEKTIKFCLWSGEEQGLLGSAAYAEEAFTRGDNIVGVFNFDMIAWDGNADSYSDLHCGTMAPSIALGTIVQDVISDYTIALVPELITSGSSGASDHASFWDYNFPAMMGIEDFSDFNPYYHTTNDNLSHIITGFFTEFVKAAMGATATLAVVTGGASPQGTIEGVVSNEMSFPIEGVYVDVVDEPIADTTDNDGEYDLRNLEPGFYDISFLHSDYRDTTVTGIEVTAGNTTTLDLTLSFPCFYVPGDVNGDGEVLGGDITFGVRYFKGLGSQPPDSCWNDTSSSWLYAAGDANGNCRFSGSDITFIVAFFKAYNPEIWWCPQTPPDDFPGSMKR